jgi:large subunit ribosomal protein L19e
MKLEGKKDLVARALGVGKGRIAFNVQRLEEIKQAITKQDIKDLVESGAINIKEIKGRIAVEKRGRRRAGSIRKKIKSGKRGYITITRKLRRYLQSIRAKMPNERYVLLRQEIKMHSFPNLAHFKERIKVLGEEK